MMLYWAGLIEEAVTALATVALVVIGRLGLRSVRLLKAANEQVKSSKLVSGLVDILGQFAENIIPLHSKWQTALYNKRLYPFLRPYTGPTRPGFIDLEFALDVFAKTKVAQQKCELPETLELLNRLEMFAASIILSINEGLVTEDYLFNPIGSTYVSICNDMYDVISKYCCGGHLNLFWYMRELHNRWDVRVSHAMYNNYATMDSASISPCFKEYREFYKKAEVDRNNGYWYFTMFLQAFNSEDKYMPGWPIVLSLGFEENGVKARANGAIFSSEPSEFIMNSSGAVFIEVTSRVEPKPDRCPMPMVYIYDLNNPAHVLKSVSCCTS